MAVLVMFDSREDRVRALDLFFEQEEIYHSVPKDCLLISDTAARALTAQGIRFRVVGGETGEGEHHGPRP